MAKMFKNDKAQNPRLLFQQFGEGLITDSYEVNDPAVKIEEGTVVTLLPTMKVRPAVAGEIPFGVVYKSNIPNDPYNGQYENFVTVGEYSQNHSRGVASGALTVGLELAQNGVDANGEPLYKAAAAAEWVSAIALTDAADTDEVFVALKVAPYLKA